MTPPSQAAFKGTDLLQQRSCGLCQRIVGELAVLPLITFCSRVEELTGVVM